MAIYNDPLDTLDNPEIRTPEFYGQMHMETWFCVLEKGIGKRDFDPAKDNLDARRTAVKLMLVPLPEHNSRYDVMRDLIVESKEWAGLVLPSVKALGITARELHGKWVKLTFQPTGRTYTKTDQTTGETVTRDATTFKFLALYPNEEACRAAYQAEHGSPGHTEPQTSAAPVPANGNNHGSAVDAEKATALKFVKVLVEQSNGDQAVLAAKIAGMPLIAKHFTAQSPEVVELVMEYQFNALSKVGNAQ
jgi:hypothetical protein